MLKAMHEERSVEPASIDEGHPLQLRTAGSEEI
jgi:hypothetical protein